MSECLTKNVETKFVRDLKGKSLSIDELKDAIIKYGLDNNLIVDEKEFDELDSYKENGHWKRNNLIHELLFNAIEMDFDIKKGFETGPKFNAVTIFFDFEQ